MRRFLTLPYIHTAVNYDGSGLTWLDQENTMFDQKVSYKRTDAEYRVSEKDIAKAVVYMLLDLQNFTVSLLFYGKSVL